MTDRLRVEHYADFGTSEPWVARLMIGIPRLIVAVPAFGKTRDAFLLDFGDVFESLARAFTQLSLLRQLLERNGAALEIEAAYANLYGAMWQAHKDRFQKAMRTLGLDIGFLFQNDAEFARRSAALIEKEPRLTDLVGLMQRDRREFQERLAIYRNDFLEHRNPATETLLAADFHHSGSAQNMFENVWQAIEDYVTLYSIANLPSAVRVIEIPEASRDPACPVRFAFELTVAHG